MKINNQKIINAWAMYDWANSVYALIITTAIFPIFYEKTTSEEVVFFGKTFVNTELYSYVISFSFMLLVVLSPILSGMADYSGNKKKYLQFFCYLGALSCISLYFFDAENALELSMLPVLLASIGFSGSLVFYNAYLPEIVTPDLQDNVSAKGFSLGYIGSSLLLIVCLVLLQGFDIPVKWVFVITGVWWIGFAQFTFMALPNNVYNKRPKGNRFLKGFNELKKVFKELKHQYNLKKYLSAFFVYSMGVQTIMLMAVFFGTKEIKWSSDAEMQTGLIVSILVIQFIAIAGAQGMAFLSKKIGNIKTLLFVVFCWIIICISAYSLVYLPLHFYIIAGSIGLVMGGIQSLSRSTYSKLLPETQDHASYFSFYDILEKTGVVIGTFFFGFIEGLFDIRSSVLILIVFFVIGFLLLLRVKSTKKILNEAATVK
ncbi:MAG: MFS transporter [Flavobacteriales bacterium]|nr:MFS transporter [Flavobacteriales bacterium]MCW8911784.1 MFS transporter [Flavobacteriales bacterium]MCW8938489.1 MFS transporter [Flavobacteriales bacterium]MCW8939929.1 MFS transporter [Flavobacteriales bacterium]MCW8967689.1 MFS transporter [Flavobacteriales bacterium]